MFNTGSGFSLADIAAAVRGNGNDGTFGGNNGWWVIIILLALWGGNGFGNNRNNSNNCSDGCSGRTTYVPVPMGGYGMSGSFGFSDAAMQRGFDNQIVIGKLDRLGDGLCSLGYDQLGQFNNVNNNVNQLAFGLERTINQGQIANMQSFNALSAQQQACCCDLKSQLGELKYDMATSDCSIKTLMNQLAQQIMWGQQNGLRDLSELINNKFCQLEKSQMEATIADLRAQVAACGNNSALQALYNQLIAFYYQQNPVAVPAYPGCNPHGVGSWNQAVLAQNGGCDCFGNNCCR